MNNFLNKHFGFTLPASIMVVAKCLKLIWNQSGIISRSYFSPFQGVYYLYRGLRRAPKPYFGLILEFWIIFHIFFEWIILLNILDSIEWIFFLNEYFGICFELNFELNHFSARFNEKMNFQNVLLRARVSRLWYELYAKLLGLSQLWGHPLKIKGSN